MPATDWAMSLLMDPAKTGVWGQNESAYLRAWSIDEGVATALDEIGPGRLTLTLKNNDCRYSPAKGVIANFGLGTPVRLAATWTTPAVTNIDENPSAETDAIGSVASGGATVNRSTVEAWVGGASFAVGTTDMGGSGIAKQKRDGSRFAVTAGQAYVWTPRVKGTAGKAMKLWIRWYNSGGTTFQTDEAAFTLGDGWVQPTLTVTAPTGAVTALVQIVTAVAQGLFTFYADACFFYQGSTLLPYCDGDQPGCSWSGTAHQSTSSRSANPTFYLFSGLVDDIDGQEDATDTQVTITCRDPMAGLPQYRVKLGNMLNRSTALILHRIVDRIEGELISSGDMESIKFPTAPPIPTGWSAVTGAAIQRYPGIIAAPTKVLEGDSSLEVTPSATLAFSGARYDATANIPNITVPNRVVIYGRSDAGTRIVILRMLKDDVVIASMATMLTTSYQRIELDVPAQGSNGTNRYIEIVTYLISSAVFYIDCLHAVPLSQAIDRAFDAGVATLPLVNGYNEPGDALLREVAASEPGRLYFRANAGSGELVFKARNARPASAIPRANLGDGDGLLPLANGMSWNLEGDDLADTAIVTSRGTPTWSGSQMTIWELAPVRNTTTGEEFGAEYSQPSIFLIILKETNVTIEDKNVNYGIGADIKVLTGGINSYIVLWGYVCSYPTERSEVRRQASSLLAVPHPPIQAEMPFQGTASSDMATEAQWLADRYSQHIWRLQVPLSAADQEAEALLFDVALGDLLLIEAKHKAYSPGIRKNFWVEGVKRNWEVGGVPHAVLSLEEK